MGGLVPMTAPLVEAMPSTAKARPLATAAMAWDQARHRVAECWCRARRGKKLRSLRLNSGTPPEGAVSQWCSRGDRAA